MKSVEKNEKKNYSYTHHPKWDPFASVWHGHFDLNCLHGSFVEFHGLTDPQFVAVYTTQYFIFGKISFVAPSLTFRQAPLMKLNQTFEESLQSASDEAQKIHTLHILQIVFAQKIKPSTLVKPHSSDLILRSGVVLFHKKSDVLIDKIR